MILSEPLESLITFFRTSFIKFYRNSQLMSDSFYHTTESSELKKKRFQNILMRPRRSAMFSNFYVGIHMYRALTYDIMKFYLTRVRDKKIRNGYKKLETRFVM